MKIQINEETKEIVFVYPIQKKDSNSPIQIEKDPTPTILIGLIYLINVIVYNFFVNFNVKYGNQSKNENINKSTSQYL